MTLTRSSSISVPRDLLLPVLTGVVAIVLERKLYNSSPALRAFSGKQA